MPMKSLTDLNKKFTEEFDKSKKYLEKIERKYALQDDIVPMALQFLNKFQKLLIFYPFYEVNMFALYIGFSFSQELENRLDEIIDKENVQKEQVNKLINWFYGQKLEDVRKSLKEIALKYSIEFLIVEQVERFFNRYKFIVINYPPRYAALYGYTLIGMALSIQNKLIIAVIQGEGIDERKMCYELSSILIKLGYNITSTEHLKDIFNSGALTELDF